MVQRDLVRRMYVAKHVPAMPAMVATLEEVEGFLAGGRIADEGVGVGFPVVTRGHAFDGGEVFVVDIEGFIVIVRGFVFGDSFQTQSLSGGSGGAATDGAAISSAVQAVSAAVQASGRCQRGSVVRPFCWSQRRGDVHGRFWRSKLATSER